MIKKLIATFTLVAFTAVMCLTPTIAYANETDETLSTSNTSVTTLSLGDPAPFPGTLFSVPAAARLLTDLEFTQQQCDLQITNRLSVQASEFQLQLDTQLARYTALQYRHTELMNIRAQQIEFLTENYQPERWYESGEFWFAAGIVGGILITVGAGYALGQAN